MINMPCLLYSCFVCYHNSISPLYLYTCWSVTPISVWIALDHSHDVPLKGCHTWLQGGRSHYVMLLSVTAKIIFSTAFGCVCDNYLIHIYKVLGVAWTIKSVLSQECNTFFLASFPVFLPHPSHLQPTLNPLGQVFPHTLTMSLLVLP